MSNCFCSCSRSVQTKRCLCFRAEKWRTRDDSAAPHASPSDRCVVFFLILVPLHKGFFSWHVDLFCNVHFWMAGPTRLNSFRLTSPGSHADLSSFVEMLSLLKCLLKNYLSGAQGRKQKTFLSSRASTWRWIMKAGVRTAPLSSLVHQYAPVFCLLNNSLLYPGSTLLPVLTYGTAGINNCAITFAWSKKNIHTF